MEKIKKIIYGVRNQPEKSRIHILNLLILICGIILLALWVYSLGSNLSSADTQAKLQQDVKPFSALKDNIVGGYNSMGESTSGTQ